MGKGVSAVIATVLMLMITIALAGSAWMTISNTSSSRTATAFSIVDTYQNTITIRNDGTSPINSFNSFTIDGTPATYMVVPQDASLLAYWNFDEGSGNVTRDSSGHRNDANMIGNIIGDFENTLDGFNLGCGGLPTTSYVTGRVGSGLKIWSTGGDGLSCAAKSLGSFATGYTVFFYGKGYVKTQLYDGGAASYVQDMETGCRTVDGGVDMYVTCNGGSPYQDWRLFKIVAYRASGGASIYIYNNNLAGEPNAGYYDFITNGPSWSNGKYGKALQFDGVNDYAEVPSYQHPTVFTMEAWIYPGSTPTDPNIGGNVINLYSAVQGTIFYYASDNTMGVRIHALPSGSYDLRSSVTLPLNRWSHVAATFNGTNLKIYVNGTERGSITGSLTPVILPLRIGSWGSCCHFNGVIDEVRIWNRSLTADEIKLEYTIGSQIVPGTTAAIKIYNSLSKGTHTVRLCTASACQTGYLTIM